MNNQNLSKRLQAIRDELPCIIPELDIIEQQIEAYEGTLAFYANTENYTQLECGATGLTTIEDDKGMRASNALQVFRGEA